MCICCLLVNASERFPFILLSVRDEMLSRPTSDVRVHPVSTTTCCLDESLPADKRGTWLAINPKLGTFSILTNSTQPGRPEPHRNTVPSRGLLVLNAVETSTGRVSEPTLAVRESWTRPRKDDDADKDAAAETTPMPANAFASEELTNTLSGFNLLSGCLLPSKLDVRYTTNLYQHCFDKSLLTNSDNNSGGAWSLSNTFLDNVKEPRLGYLKQKAMEALRGFESSAAADSSKNDNSNKTVDQLADCLGAVLLLRPNFSDADLPFENLNLSEGEKTHPVDIELERVCQRNIASYGVWWDPPLLPPMESLPSAFDEAALSKQDQKKTNDDEAQQRADEEMLRENSKVDLAKFKVSPALSPAKVPTKMEWGTRMHTVVIVEKTASGVVIHYFDRKIDIKVDEQSPKVGVAQQPPHEFVPLPWTHLQWQV